MSVQAYDKLTQPIRAKIESSSQEPSAVSLLVKTGLSLLLPAGASLTLFTSLGKTRVVDLTRLGNKMKIAAMFIVGKLALISVLYHVMKYSKQENLARMKSIHSLISAKLGANQYVAVRINNTTYCIDSAGVTREEGFDKTGKTLLDVTTLFE